MLTVTTGLTGVTAALFDGARPFAAQKWSSISPLLLMTAYLAMDAAMIMWSALSIKELDHSGNAPKNLAKKDIFQLELRLIKFAEAESYQGRIERNHSRNETVGERINLGIKLACFAPAVYLGALIAAHLIFRS